MNKIDSNDNLTGVSFGDGCSVVVVTHRRPELLKRLVNSLLRSAQEVAEFPLQFIYCVNGTDNESVTFLETDDAIKTLGATFVVLDSPVSPAEARNLAVEKAKYRWIGFLDDDVEVPHDYFRSFVSLKNKSPDVCVWGGPNLTPPQSSSTQQRIGWYLGNPLVTGPISRRYRLYGLDAPGGEFTFSLCNMFVKTEIFNRFTFNVVLKTAEENELIYRIRSSGHRMNSSDALFVWHSRRTGMDGFLKQIRNYGFGRGQVIHNGRVSILVPALIPVGIATVLTATSFYPRQALAAFFLWQVTVYLQMLRRFGFSSETSREFLLSARILFNYLTGVFVGYISAAKKSRIRISKAKPSS